MSECNRSKSKEQFCAVGASGKCKCGNNYKKNCEPGQPWDLQFNFKQRGGGGRKVQIKYNAHHILCVASVGVLIVDAVDKQVDGVVRQTVWCVNKKPNMLAMPLWGHTVQWYCSLTAASPGGGHLDAPNFQNMPQHDWDHDGNGSYIEELNKEIVDLVDQIAQQPHEAKPVDLAGALDGMSTDFKEKLETRGKRQGGTHKAWQDGHTNKKWYEPFSMASDGSVSAKEYPALDFNEEVMGKLKWLAEQVGVTPA